jgi:hypothetical protein
MRWLDGATETAKLCRELEISYLKPLQGGSGKGGNERPL